LALSYWLLTCLLGGYCPTASAQQATTTGKATEPEPTGGTSLDSPQAEWLHLKYEPSHVLKGVEFLADTRRTEAQGSDIWPITWADDGHQYTAYGDGAGFGVRSAREQSGMDRVSLGVSRIEGDWHNYQGKNVWGGKSAEHPAQFRGKATGLLSVEGVLYMWVGGPDSRVIERTQLAVSHDHAKTWRLADWSWTIDDRVFAGTFLNFGRNYAGARDDYVYSYFTRIEQRPEPPRSWIHERPGQVDLARVPKKQMNQRSAYEWFAGLADSGEPRWTANISAKRAVFTDPNGIKLVSVCHAPGIERCLLVYNPRTNNGNFGLFEAPEPWGPWKQVAYLRGQALFMPPEPNMRVSVFHFAPKWWDEPKGEFTLIFNTGDDAWNTIRGRLVR
jgi:hypothetical protein